MMSLRVEVDSRDFIVTIQDNSKPLSIAERLPIGDEGSYRKEIYWVAGWPMGRRDSRVNRILEAAREKHVSMGRPQL